MPVRKHAARFSIVRNSILLLFFATIVSQFFYGSEAIARQKRNEVLYWNKVALDLIKKNKVPPPKASRILGLLHVSMFEAANASNHQYQSYDNVGVGHELKGQSIDALVSSAAARVLMDQFPEEVSSIDLLIDGDQASGVGLWGSLIAQRIQAHHPLQFGSMEDPAVVKGYAWIVTPPSFSAYLLPEWCALQPLGISSPKQFRKSGPPPMDSAAFLNSLDETKKLGGKNSIDRTADQTQIALFWADGAGTVTPPGHWNQIAADIIKTRNLSTLETARIMALLNLALADAAIVAWDMKHQYQLARPITIFGNESWEPLIVTPPFPEYVSGHSTFSGAGAAILTALLGNQPFTTQSDAMPGVTRSFKNFTDAALEAGRSRIYGGIHFAFSDIDGQEAGQGVANYILQHELLKLSPTKGDHGFACVLKRSNGDDPSGLNGNGLPICLSAGQQS